MSRRLVVANDERVCPVCYRSVSWYGPQRLIEAHMDSLRWRECPASREPFRITIAADLAFRADDIERRWVA